MTDSFRYYESGVADERERIIKLLEATSDLTSIECGELVNYADTAIALIKGEQPWSR